MIDVRELKDKFDKMNYTEEELSILRGESVPDKKEFNKLVQKVIRLGDTEYILKLLGYSSRSYDKDMDLDPHQKKQCVNRKIERRKRLNNKIELQSIQ